MITQTALLELSIELAQGLTADDRFDRLLTTLRKAITCEAVAILVLKNDYLQPLALQGLNKGTLGRRFKIAEHPRFQQICRAGKAVRFPSDSPLPDPYDGLLIDREGDLPIHACMGLPLFFNQKLIGVLTMDSFTPNVFDHLAERTLELISSMAAVSLQTALTLNLLEDNVNHSKIVLQALNEPSAFNEPKELIGDSPAMAKLKQEIMLVAPSNYSVLIEGESGTGKELVAHNIHWHSSRANEPIIYVNCAALPENLIESELFGHVKGAFTGADSNRAGKFLVANGGTLFLDEIGELPLAAQSKLLRALQSNEIQPVGQDDIINIDVRVVAATNRNLAEEVAAERFRADLYHRLNVYPILVPALRQRENDVELLSGFFLEKLKRKLGLGQLKLSNALLAKFKHYSWPGNVRELEHLLSRAALKASAKSPMLPSNKRIVQIDTTDCDQLGIVQPNFEPQATTHNSPVQAASFELDENMNLRQAVDDFQANVIRKTLTEENGNWSRSAKRLGIDRANLNRLAKRLGISVTKSVN